MKNIIVKKFSKKGRGVFAQRDFKKGETIARIKGKILTKDQLYSSSRYLNDHSGPIGYGKYIVFGYPEKYINHSCSPNVFEYKRKVLTISDIRKGEELTFDYSICSVDDWKMKCHCECSNCRKTVMGGFFNLPKKIQRRYLPYLDEWFRKEFREEIKKLER